MITWGLLAIGMMFVRTPLQFYVMRFLLGAAEAGLLPGRDLLPDALVSRRLARPGDQRLLCRLPAQHRVDGRGRRRPAGACTAGLGLRGWQWLFLVEGLPAVMLSLRLPALPDRPDTPPG